MIQLLLFPCKANPMRLESLMCFGVKSFWAREEITVMWRQKLLDCGKVSMSCPRSHCHSFKSLLQNKAREEETTGQRGLSQVQPVCCTNYPMHGHYSGHCRGPAIGDNTEASKSSMLVHFPSFVSGCSTEWAVLCIAMVRNPSREAWWTEHPHHNLGLLMLPHNRHQSPHKAS